MAVLQLLIAVGLCALAAIDRPEGHPLRRSGVRAAILIAAALPAIVAFFRGALPGWFPFDDSYISLSAARTFVEHHQIAVIRGRPLQGVTSPLHILLTGLLGLAVGIEWAARLVSLSSFVFIVVGAARWAETAAKDPRAYWAAGALCLFAGPLLFDIGNGMETSLFTALLVWSFLHASVGSPTRARSIGLGALLGLAMLTRPEGAFLTVAVIAPRLTLGLWKRDKGIVRSALLTGAAVAIVYAPYLIANLVYTGHVLPPTVNAKSMFFRSGAWEWPTPSNLSMPFAFFFAGAEIVGLAGLAGLALGRRWAEGAFLLIFYLSYLTRFPDALKHYRARYQHPIWPILAVGAALLVVAVARRLDRRTWARRIVPPAAALILICATLFAANRYRAQYNQDLVSTRDFLLPTVRYVNAHTPKGMYVAAHDVGALMYFGERYVVDVVGLTDARVARMLAEDHRGPAAIPDVLIKRRPYLLVLLRRWEEEFLRITENAPPGMFTLMWSSPPNPTNGAIYDVYRCRLSVPPPAVSGSPVTFKP